MMLNKNKDNFDKNEYDISAVEEEIIIKNPDTEKIKLEYYKLYLKTIKTYIDFTKNKPLKAENIEKTKTWSIILK